MPYCVTDSQDERNIPMCKEIGEYLCTAYPGYSWHIRIDGGLLIIKNPAINGNAAMVRKIKSLDFDAGVRKREVISAAGEFLECAGLRRGMATGEIAKHLEGMSKGEKFKPIIVPGATV